MEPESTGKERSVTRSRAAKAWMRWSAIGVKLFRNLSYRIRFRLRGRFSLYGESFGVYDGPQRKEKIIVSLTSFPARMPKLHLGLQSILLQSVRPDRIILWLASDEMGLDDVPEKVRDLQRLGLEIRFCNENLKPHNKYINTLQEFPEAVVITVDDDILYSPDLVADLVAGHELMPGKVICTRAHRIKASDGVILPYRQWEYESTNRDKASHALMATGVGGVLYPPHSLPQETFDALSIRGLCLKADDVWLKAMEILSGTKVFAIPSTHTQYMVGIFGSGKQSLRKENVRQNMNDKYVADVFARYGITASALTD